MSAPESFDAWLADRRVASDLRMAEIGLSACAGWRLEAGRLVHETGAFFSVVAVEAEGRIVENAPQTAAYIDQPEVGLLGFVLRKTESGLEWLLHAKTEPGNVDAAQVAPTVQATRSNYMMRHGGRATRYLDLFGGGAAKLSDSAQSEQGTRFLWKFNRNMVVAVPPDAAPEPEPGGFWRWWPTATVRDLLGRSFQMNTDARSVIATAPWALLAQHRPLFRSGAAQRSYAARPALPAFGQDRINYPAQRISWSFLPLDALPDWRWDDTGLFDPFGHQHVVFRDVAVRGREVDAWCQPFLSQPDDVDADLLLRLRDGKVEVFLSYATEIGFGGRREFGPSLQSNRPVPDKLADMLEDATLTELAAIRQSDEGGRFMHDIATYRLVLADGLPERPIYPFGIWVGLSTLEKITRRAGATTNELRSLVSLLLSDEADQAMVALDR